MKTMLRLAALSTGLWLLSACGGPSSGPAATEAAREAALRDSAFGDLAESMDRAAEIEQLQMERKRELDAAIEQ